LPEGAINHIEDPPMHMKRRFASARAAKVVIAAAAVAMLAACGSDSTGPRNTNVAGTYDLSTVDGSSLPYTVPNTGDNTEIVQNATITLNADSTYSAIANGTENGESSVVIADEGHYSVSGSQVTFTSTVIEGGNYTGNVSGSTLTVTIVGAFVGSSDASFSLVFTKTS
jgi:ABC-type oligopeptide transport system substrate-binding subunit